VKWGVVTFPGSLDDRDALYSLETVLGQEVVSLWHKDRDLHGVEAIILPGGFSYGDYLRCGAIAASPGDSFPARLARIHSELSALLTSCRPECVAIENLFHAVNVRSALKLGHARGVAMLAAVEAGCEVVEYTPAEIKRAVVGYGRAEKHQVGQMVKLLLGLAAAPSPHDAADALAVAVCHIHSQPPARAARAIAAAPAGRSRRTATSWRHYRP